MNALLELLIDHGTTLLAGSTVVLGTGALAVAATRAPLHRRRLAELTLAAVVVWLAAALMPLPRWNRTPTETAAVAPVARSAGAASAELAMALQREPPTPARASLPTPPPKPITVLGPPPWPRLLAWGYVAGCGLALGYLLLGVRALRRVLRGAQPPAPWLSALLDELHTDRPGRPPRLRVAEVAQPFCCGLRTPTIVLPRALATPAQRSRLRQVLLHELAHLQQRDPRGRTLFALTLPLLFFHPLYWWLRGTARLSAELVADECAAGHSDRTTYARELLSVCEEFGRRRALVGTAPVFASRSEFYRRMKMLLQRERPLVTTCSPLRRLTQGAAMALLVAGTASVFGVEARAQEAAPKARAAGEVEELRAERDRLRRELRAMRKAFAQAQRETVAEPVTELPPEPPAPPEPANPIATLELLRQAPPGLPGTPARATAPVAELLEDVTEPRPAIADAPAPLPALADVFERAAAAPQPPQPPTPTADAYVLDLVMRSIELSGEVELQQAAVEDASRHRDRGVGTEREFRNAEIRLHTAARKMKVIERAIEGERGRVAEQLAGDDLSPSQRRRLQRQLELLDGSR